MNKPSMIGHKPSIIITVVTRKMFPFVLMFGFYIILHGGTSPGGGFQGGVVIGAAYILFAIGCGAQEGRKFAPELIVKAVESSGVLLFVCVGLVGIALGYSFLANNVAGFHPHGAPGTLLSGGTLFWINIGIGMHVGATVLTMFYSFLEFEGKEKKEINEEGGNAGAH